MSDKIKILTKMTAVLDCFTPARRRLTVAELAERTGLPRPTVHRIVAALRDDGFIEQDRKRDQYRLGIKLFQLGTTVLSSLDLRRDAAPVVEELTRATGQTVHLSIFDGLNSTVITRSSQGRADTNTLYVLDASPAHATASGKVALAYQAAPAIARFLENPRAQLTPNTIVDESALLDELSRIRDRGYGRDDEELRFGTKCFAGPIRGPSGKVFAAISVSGASADLGPETEPGYAKLVISAGDRVSRLLGHEE
ncbi:IclR family transcriptional regulator [Tropicimonas sp. IMCC34011]|uniref:IclR family transcriptional regulator n=1 Tax=Tropicimonas sp. IMCC34011 TaxID=2248759 RepID=UPI0018E5731E|nr:IclR family transcriptional regulator [Tropicimonas sp. IMCC34011]